MSNTLLDLSTKVDQTVMAAISDVADAAAPLGVSFFIVGAMARDFLLKYPYGISTGRATGDVDFGVRIGSWHEYEALAAELTGRGFTRDRKIRHRFTSPNSILIDLVPFGPIAGKGNEVRWPSDEARRMKVEGYEAAMASAVEVLLRTEPRLVVRVASLPGLAVLKILSFEDAFPGRNRDAGDLYIIMDTYMETANIDRLSTDARDLVAEPIPPLQEIGARLLGRDMARLSDSSDANQVTEILRRELSDDGPFRLLLAMKETVNPSTTEDDILALLRALERGFLEGSRKGPVNQPGTPLL